MHTCQKLFSKMLKDRPECHFSQSCGTSPPETSKTRAKTVLAYFDVDEKIKNALAYQTGSCPFHLKKGPINLSTIYNKH